MKRFLALMLAMMMLCLLPLSALAEQPPRIVTTIFPVYDWVLSLLGENPGNVEVTLLQDSGLDLHNYQPTVADILSIGTSDLFIYVGGESDGWVEGALKNAINPDMVAMNLLTALGDAAHEEELVEGMEAEEHDHDHDHENADKDHDHEEEDHDHDHEEVAYDEHVWLSLRNAMVLCRQIHDALCQIDPANAAYYGETLTAYTAELAALDAEYQAAVEAGTQRVLLFGDRFPFRYLTEDYGLTYYAAFLGCSAETEASFSTISFLAGKADELGLHAVMTLEGSDHQLAETIIRTAKTEDLTILEMNSMQSIVRADIDAGANYLDIMRSNLDALRTALQ